MQNHHLNKLTIKSTTTSESEGFVLRRLLKDNWQQLLPDLTESFDDVCAEGDVIYLPKISISLEVDSMDSLVSEIPNNHNQSLKDQIITQVMQQVQTFKTKSNTRESNSSLFIISPRVEWTYCSVSSVCVSLFERSIYTTTNIGTESAKI